MGLITRPYSFSPGTTIQSAQVNSNETTIYNEFNGAIDGTNISSLAESKVAFSGTGHAHSGGAGGAPVQLVAGSAIASAATISIPTDGNYFNVTGTTGITAINARTSGVFAILKFAGALILTHNVTTLILLDGQSILTQAGDIICLISEGGGNWREVWRLRPAAYGSYRVVGLTGANNAGAPNTKMDFAADVVVARRVSGGETATKANTGTITCDTGVAGPAINARDQAGAFGASTWLHFYFIYNVTTDTWATTVSTTAPPTGPTLPSGYTHWAYIGAVYYDAASHLLTTYVRGQHFRIITQTIINGGATSVEQTASLVAAVPPNALTVFVVLTNTVVNANLRVVSGTDFMRAAANGGASQINAEFQLPNVSQTVYLKTSTANIINLDCTGYTVPNGG